MSIDLELLGERIAAHAAHLDAATHTLLTDLREFDSAGGWYKQGARTCAEWLSWRLGWNMGTAREHVRVARRLAELPLVDDALCRGSLSFCKVRAITRVATPANEALLLEDATHATGAQLERICRKYAAVMRAANEPEESYDRERRYVRRQDLDDGMVKIEAVLHPEEAATIWAAIEAVARARRELAKPKKACGTNGANGASGAVDTDGASGAVDTDGASNAVGASDTDGASGASGASDTDGASDSNGATSDSNGATSDSNGASGAADTDGASGTADTSGASGAVDTDDAGNAMEANGAQHGASDSNGATSDSNGVSGVDSVYDTGAFDAARAIDSTCANDRAHANGVTNETSEDRGGSAVVTPAELARVVVRIAAEPPPRIAPSETDVKSRFDRADAFVAIARDVLRGERVHAVPTELVVTVAAETLASPHTVPAPFAVTRDGTCVSAETARRLACDCGVVHVTEDEVGNAISVGRKARTIPTSMKRALLRRDATCRFPGCCNRVFLEGHHVQHWANGGETSLRNLVTMCSFHHRFVHEYGYRVELDDRQEPRFLDPRGRLVTEHVPRPPLSRSGISMLVEAHRDRDISAETNEPRWDGDPVNYGWVIDDLVHVDRLQ